jgi:tetratricopeptide (TPR) repeat protein
MSKILVLFFLTLNLSGFAQFFSDTKAKEACIAGLDFMYNYDFDKSKLYFDQILEKYPQHPAGHILQALYLQNSQINLERSPYLKSYLLHLNQALSKAKTLEKNIKYKKEASYFIMVSHGLIALHHNNKDDKMAAALEAKKAYGIFSESKKYKTEIADFYFSSGIYNYYREIYPELHPIVKPVVFFFDKGNKSLGLKELKMAEERSIFSRNEAQYYLGHISIKYEGNFKMAKDEFKKLHVAFPRNIVYLRKYVEALLWLQDFSEAEIQLQKLSKYTDAISQKSSLTFKGYLAQHAQKNKNLAFEYYQKAIAKNADIKKVAEYQALAELGMAQILKEQKKTEAAKNLLKKAKNNAEYLWLISKIDNEIKSF